MAYTAYECLTLEQILERVRKSDPSGKGCDLIERACHFAEKAHAGQVRKSGEPYPALPLIEKMRRSGIPVVISDDAHHAEDLGADFDKIEKILQKMNYTNRWKLNKD